MPKPSENEANLERDWQTLRAKDGKPTFDVRHSRQGRGEGMWRTGLEGQCGRKSHLDIRI